MTYREPEPTRRTACIRSSLERTFGSFLLLGAIGLVASPLAVWLWMSLPPRVTIDCRADVCQIETRGRWHVERRRVAAPGERILIPRSQSPWRPWRVVAKTRAGEETDLGVELLGSEMHELDRRVEEPNRRALGAVLPGSWIVGSLLAGLSLAIGLLQTLVMKVTLEDDRVARTVVETTRTLFRKKRRRFAYDDRSTMRVVTIGRRASVVITTTTSVFTSTALCARHAEAFASDHPLRVGRSASDQPLRVGRSHPQR
jgi:hypothetical protein